MSTFLAYFLGVTVIAPFLVYIALFSFVKWVTGHHKSAVNFAVDGTTPFMIIAVYFLLLSIWEVSLLWVLLLVMCMVGITFSFYKWRREPDFEWRKVWKGFWRINFLLYTIGYVFLFLCGLTLEVFQAVIR
ncbi:DUF3397 domain-containing protein [Jeotgalibacillus soli]|uniref:DUF3397 domain-containing protein n=1 Tax=Jeotgalibacillus soli TaxID=889306 RepID=A0A0C2R3E0_9BACL|nr:DUF3397 domain-containing protein [Jeotgalibacillus soli]KIL44785.1 hypothetical protein KP78_23290 [Jeotgalibacillus soli]